MPRALRGYLLADWDADTLDSACGDTAARKTLREHLDRLLASGEVGAPARADAQADRPHARAGDLGAAGAARARAAAPGRCRARRQTVLSIEPAALAAAQRVLTRASGAPLETGVSALYARGAQAPLRARVSDTLRQLERESPWVLGAAPEAALADAAARARLLETDRGARSRSNACAPGTRWCTTCACRARPRWVRRPSRPSVVARRFAVDHGAVGGAARHGPGVAGRRSGGRRRRARPNA